MLDFLPTSLSADAVGPYTWGFMRVRENPSSNDYLNFAKQDLQDGKEQRNLVNSISNAKRALHLRLEDLCLGFGSRDLTKLKRSPALLGYVRSCGIVAPNVLDRLNRLRNEVEHDYHVPEIGAIENFVDVTELFLAATDRWRDRQPCEADYFQEVVTTSGTICIVGLSFDWKDGVARISYCPKDAKSRIATSSIEYRSPSEEYFTCVQFLISNNY